MKSELDTSKASFKLDLIETANADPMLTPADLKVLVAYVSVMKWPSCKAWLATSLAIGKTGLSGRQFEKSRARLLGGNAERRTYLLAARYQESKVSTYHLINPWRDEAIAHVEAVTKHHREIARMKTAKRRAASPNTVRGPDEACHRTVFGRVTELSSDKYPSVSTPREERTGENDLGLNVVPFKGTAA